ncbi:MAG: hypothetical protein GTO18_22205 [Anaerolineales bacterium]|nr:hypothetical protein [Anaerolineales bacterium]
MRSQYINRWIMVFVFLTLFTFACEIFAGTPASPSPEPTEIPPTALPSRTPEPPSTQRPSPTPEQQPSNTPPPVGAPTSTLSPECLPAEGDPLTAETIADAFLELKIESLLESGLSAECVVAMLNRLETTIMADVTPEPVIAQAVTADVTGNGLEDIVLSINIPYGKGYGEAHVYAFRRWGGGYETDILFRRAGAGSAAEGLYSGGGAQIREVSDVNRDDVPEIVFSVSWPYETLFYIAQWQGAEFSSLIETYSDFFMDTIYYATSYENEGLVADYDGDGTLELILYSRPWSLVAEKRLDHDRLEIWAWDGELYSLSTIDYGQPIYRYEAVYFGDDALLYGDYENSLAYYQQAIFDEELIPWGPGHSPETPEPPVADPEERPNLEAYSRYRILLLHSMMGYMDAAEVVYDTLMEKFPGGSVGRIYAEMATVFYNMYLRNQSMSEACASVIELAAGHEDVIINPLSSDTYGQDGREYTLEDMCPFK